MPKKSSHPHVAWRDGRPRFQPGRDLRDQGFKGKDLRHDDGRWYSRGEAVDWSIAFQKKLEDLRAAPARSAATAEPPTGGRRLSGAPAGAKGRSSGSVRPRQSPYTVAQLFEDFWRSPRFQPGSPRAYARKTVVDYRQKANVIATFDETLYNSAVVALTQPILRGLFEELWAERGLATAKGAILTLSTAISWGMLRGKVTFSNGVSPASRLKMETPEPRVRFATRAEISALVAAADRIGRPEIGDMIVLAVWTGQRQGDRLALVDRGLLNGRRYFRQSKTNAIVAIRQAPELEARLKEAAERRREPRAKALLKTRPEDRPKVELRFAHFVLDERSWQPFRADHYRHVFAEVRAAAVAGDETKGAAPVPSLADFWDLDLRDTSVTWQALAGATIPEIIAVTGHTMESATSILKHYLARHPEMADASIGKMIEWFDAGGETETGI